MGQGNANGFNIKLLLISLALAILATYIGYGYLKKIENASLDKPKYIKIIVAARDIPARAKIDSNMIEEIEVNETSYLLNSLQKKDEILGKFTKEKILKGELIPRERLMEEDTEDLSLRIPEGKRAVSISMDEMSGVGDLIRPGDYVDVYVTVDQYIIDKKTSKTIYPQITKLLLQDIEVLAVSKEMKRVDDQRTDIPVAYAVTLGVNAYEGEKLVHGEDFGRLKLALRPLTDKNIYNTPGTIRFDIVPEKGVFTIQK
ncbi:MAG: Flp pilus assembly protein CpaB [Maledivibacter sp.]|nr:Flp pilus assembly protein CpaB [Maledivibacter sp.]